MLKLLLITVFLLFSGSIGVLYLTRSKPVLLRIPPDSNIRPRYYCILNPFRDRGPEIVAEDYLNQLHDGKVQSISCCVGEQTVILEKEAQWPIQSWRVGNRTDKAGTSYLQYWVKRGNGYMPDGYEEEVHFEVVLSGGDWKLQSFGAIY